MRVTLLQLVLDAGSRSMNLQRIIAAIDSAARSTPAPDLIVLPGAVDTGGAVAKSDLAVASLHGVHELLSFKAREWGVCIAAGIHMLSEGEIFHRNILLDADGDVVADAINAGSSVRDGGTTRLWRSVVADIGIAMLDGRHAPDAPTDVGTWGAFVALPTMASGSRQREARAKHLAKLRDEADTRGKACWGVAVPAVAAGKGGREDTLRSFVCDAGGAVLAFAPAGEEAFVEVEVPIQPAPPAAEPMMSMRNDDAD